MIWEPKRSRVNWRKFLTKEEAAFMARADKAAERVAKAQSDLVAKYGRERMLVVNRAVQRAKYAARKS